MPKFTLLGITCLILLFVGTRYSASADRQIHPTPTPTAEALTILSESQQLWEQKGTSDYRITIVTGAPPAPQVALKLTIQNDQITQDSILACDAPSDEYPASDCDTIRRYYSSMGRYTINQFFDLAADSIRRTQDSLAKCNAFPTQGFQGFSGWDDLWKAMQTCQNVLDSSDLLASVEYDAEYGYPKRILRIIPQSLDGASSIEIKDFQTILASENLTPVY